MFILKAECNCMCQGTGGIRDRAPIYKLIMRLRKPNAIWLELNCGSPINPKRKP